MRFKYPRTPHLPWSESLSSDDVKLTTPNHFQGKNIVVTEKMDGENTTLYRDGLHARSIDSRYHPSRSWVSALHGKIGWQIPEGWRICGENLYARHSISYDELPSYFMVFSIWNEQNICLNWQDTCQMASELRLCTVPVLYQGLWDEAKLRQLKLDTTHQEGYVVRIQDHFHFDDFSQSIAKWVRRGHVNTTKHWMFQTISANGLRSRDDS
ncbi:RNA ligase family protein [Celerinatantimonas sp. MCCC 1A17872]|uniref:RNA ligase family protein n=1 Tax=Celerinatantimonas sp. MCCC 1A17872 TaxID=3177514 RepID=UPI0038C684A5